MVFARSPKQHIEHVRFVLNILRDAGVKLQVMKCVLLSATSNYLCLIIRSGKLEVSTHAREAIEGLQQPTNLTELRYFLGMCNVFRRCLPNFACVASSLNTKLQNEEPFKFGDLKYHQLSALEALK